MYQENLGNDIYQLDNDIYQNDNDIYQDDMYYPPIDNYNWSPNLFAKLTSFLQESTSPDVIRMGIIAGIRNSVSTEETPTTWDKVEAMRRYVDRDYRRTPPLCRFFVPHNGRATVCSQ